MKFLVDELPYYDEYCPFASTETCYASVMSGMCPKYWSKDKVNSHKNPHECEILKEVSVHRKS